MNETINSTQAAEYLGISGNNLRQLVHRKLLVPTGRLNRRSLFQLADVERVKAARAPKE